MIAIFKREYRAFFTSPLGYVFIAAFLAVINTAFYAYNILYLDSGLAMVFTVVMYAMLVLTPLITMRSFSEEKKQKTEQLILTAPIGLMRIVAGKFLAAFAVFMTGMIFTLIYLFIVGMFGTVIVSEFIGNFVAVTCLTMALISIGIFISSLTENQFIAAVLTICVNALLLLFDLLADMLAIPFVEAMIKWISLISRFSTLANGIFSFADIFYYLSITVVFLFLTTRVLEKKRWS